MSEKLKPCPFCGGEAEYQALLGRIICKCGAEYRHHAIETMEEAIEKWNTRAERTCRMRNTSWDDGQCTWGCKCSTCNERFEHQKAEYIGNYCPNCGAKVVSKK